MTPKQIISLGIVALLLAALFLGKFDDVAQFVLDLIGELRDLVEIAD